VNSLTRRPVFNVSLATPHRFVALIAPMSERDWLDEIAVYIVDASTIAAAKHWCVRWATLFSVPTVFFWILTVLVLFCAGHVPNL
jgi:hypothetical protein